MPDLSDLEAELEVLRAVVDTINRGEAPVSAGDAGAYSVVPAASTPPPNHDVCVCGEINARHCPVHGQGEPAPSLWKLLPEQGPHSRCSVRGCDERAVAMHDGRRRRWVCRKHLPDEAVSL